MEKETRRAGARGLAPADRMEGLVVVAPFCFWAIVLGLVPGLALRSLFAG